MPLPICAACGVQQGAAPPPAICPICADARQFVPEGGQVWTDFGALGASRSITWRAEAAGVWSLRLDPHFAIGQRAFLIERPGGAILWDCLSLLDDATRTRIAGMGGLSAIAISHPHYYSAIVEWAQAFDAPVHVHAADERWLQRRDPLVRLWEGEALRLDDEATIIRCGGHFDGAAVLHDGAALGGRGALFSGDTIQVVADRRHVSFMYSYPNLVPLGAAAVRRIVAAVRPFAFDAVFGAFPGRTIASGGKAAIERSVARYLHAIGSSEEAK
ncbi:MBL fold metallo-hydrolase [Pikeienuella piscinae]|uniref:MBL fold metallo-hydrolase n=1 Tax=Pikeienuella piscinae TaxID=2748098 RepID=A0A7M3T7J2_9RHOB|nr:MBL fold metallo-hydrolase [Pikeienuella piscinae]